ncbi:MAG: energy transducer TonB [Rhodocyclales bacterium]|nr:energy transducer TonB [Rhodocyclales bacterium]
MKLQLAWDKLTGVTLVAAMHVAALWGLWQHRLIPGPDETAALFVNFIAPPAPAKQEAPTRPPPQARPIEKPQPRQIVAESPTPAPADYIAPPLTPTPAPAIEAPPVTLPAGPVVMAAELSVACPERPAPGYPPLSRRMGEAGITVLKVELDERGQVVAASVASGSAYPRLDEAALAAVKTWRCTPARRDGRPVRAVALQPFKFVLQGN